MAGLLLWVGWRVIGGGSVPLVAHGGLLLWVGWRVAGGGSVPLVAHGGLLSGVGTPRQRGGLQDHSGILIYNDLMPFVAHSGLLFVLGDFRGPDSGWALTGLDRGVNVL